MAECQIELTHLWKAAFSKKEDGHDTMRKRLANSLLRFRERVGSLLTSLPGDMKNFTVHDLTHLDALWEIADLIAGPDFSLNPAEAYVFGGAVLLHDAGMSVSAFTNGIEDLKKTEQWSDSLAATIRKREHNSKDPSADLTAEEFAVTVTDALRVLHAKKAKDLALQSWEYPKGTGQQFLCEETDLRGHYGNLIGEIAYSHHWSVDDVLKKLPSSLGSFGSMPIEWSVDSVKVALLLRCADAAHIDHRRAPRLLFALTRPTNISYEHWNFQSKISKPMPKSSKLLYTSTSPFKVDESESWQLCFDTVKMIDKELNDASDILTEKKIPSFQTVGVVGAKSPKTLSEHVEVVGWKPLPTEIQVSDVPSLARTLGGYDLYSDDIVPIRELIQNAADAIDARIAIDGDFEENDGKIAVRIIEKADEGKTYIEVEDNGIGMSEKTLTGALIDFGFSFWRSEAARNEFPGLQSKFRNPRGRYGIGFFSVFMWAESVTVSSRKYDQGINDAKVLEFSDGLGKRPLVRIARAKEASTKFTTKITMKIDIDRWKEIFEAPSMKKSQDVSNMPIAEREHYLNVRRFGPRDGKNFTFDKTLSILCATLHIPVTLDIKGNSEIINLPNWKTSSTDEFISFLERIFPDIGKENRKKFSRAESKITKDGEIIGRAFLVPIFERQGYAQRGIYAYESGIKVGLPFGSYVYGVIEAKAENAARDRYISYDLKSDKFWLDSQKDYLSRISENIGETLACQETLLSYGVFMEDKPLFVINRKIVSLNQLLEIVKDENYISIHLDHSTPLRSRSGPGPGPGSGSVLYGVKSVEGSGPFIGRIIDETRIHFLVSAPGSVLDNVTVSKLKEGGNSPLESIISMIINAKTDKRVVEIKFVPTDQYNRAMIMVIEIKDEAS